MKTTKIRKTTPAKASAPLNERELGQAAGGLTLNGAPPKPLVPAV